MEVDYDYITEEMVCDWEREPEFMATLDYEVRIHHGISAVEYIDLRNNLLKEYNGKLPTDVLARTLWNKSVIDLVGQGYFELKIDMDRGPYPVVTEKGYRLINKAKYYGDLCPAEDDVMAALFYLRTKNKLDN